MSQNLYLGKRAFAGQVARAGESGVVAVSYVNKGDKKIKGGHFVAQADGGCKNVSAVTDRLLGVSVVMGIHHEFKPNRNLSVMSIPHGSEIWVEMAADSTLNTGDVVKVIATGDEAGCISHDGGITTQFYVSGVLGNLAKIMRDENIVPTITTTKAGAK